MKAKLIKTSNGIYDLFEGTRFISTTDSPDGTANKLSLKNCQAIELGYDLEELADEFAKTKSSHSTFQNTHKRDFREGFQKALEILGDKKFSEENVLDAWEDGATQQHPLTKSKKENLLKSLQQTEWDVEIIEECLDKDCDGVDRKGDCITTGKPKLDAEGCLILKRI
jgi:hypothetical protein